MLSICYFRDIAIRVKPSLDIVPYLLLIYFSIFNIPYELLYFSPS